MIRKDHTVVSKLSLLIIDNPWESLYGLLLEHFQGHISEFCGVIGVDCKSLDTILYCLHFHFRLVIVLKLSPVDTFHRLVVMPPVTFAWRYPAPKFWLPRCPIFVSAFPRWASCNVPSCCDLQMAPGWHVLAVMPTAYWLLQQTGNWPSWIACMPLSSHMVTYKSSWLLHVNFSVYCKVRCF